MKKIFFPGSFFFLLLLSGEVWSQQVVRDSVSSIRAFDPLKERMLIPGATMGQKLESLLFWSVDEKERRFPVMQKIFPSDRIESEGHVFPLIVGRPIEHRFIDHENLDSYMKRNHIAGVIVLQNDTIRLESYGEGFNRHSVWTSFSVAKSVASMLLGIALKEGFIGSMEDPLSTYIPELKGKDYGEVTVRQLLTMTSGIAWNEDYEDPRSDVAQMNLGNCEGAESHILTYMKDMRFAHKPGQVWNYSTGETGLLGILIQKATGKNLSAYLSEKIWKPWGMEQEAHWLTDECSGLNTGGHGISASLRDYARLGTVMLHQGRRGDTDLFAEEWLAGVTKPLYQTNKSGGGYGYLWWCFPNGSYAAFGIFGQMIYVNPKENIVIVQSAAWDKATSESLIRERTAFIDAIERALK